jgi:hypothetical protein
MLALGPEKVTDVFLTLEVELTEEVSSARLYKGELGLQPFCKIVVSRVSTDEGISVRVKRSIQGGRMGNIHGCISRVKGGLTSGVDIIIQQGRGMINHRGKDSSNPEILTRLR